MQNFSSRCSGHPPLINPLWLLVFLLFLPLSCEESEPKVTPPDGNGGGVIAYCYQPLQGPALKEIYTINADGTGNIKISDAQIGLNHHDWSPDAQAIVAVGYVSQATWSIYVFNAEDGSNLTRLTSTDGVWDNEPTWSPDGAFIAFTRIYPDQDYREELWLMNADGSDQTYLGIEGSLARWSPDGSRFIYTSKSAGNYDIYTCRIDGTDIQQLTETEGEEYFPAYSPDGNYIAFAASSDGSYGGRELFIMTAEGTDLLRLTENSVFDNYPRWSPDGALICFSSDLSAHQHWEVYRINSDGTDLQRVTYTADDATAINPVWRPE